MASSGLSAAQSTCARLTGEGLASEAGSEGLHRTGDLVPRGTRRSALDGAAEGTAANRVARRQLQLAAAAERTHRDDDLQLHAVLELIDGARRWLVFATDEDATEVPPDDAHLDLVARPDPGVGTVDVPHSAH